VKITKQNLKKIIRENVLLEQDKITATVGPAPILDTGSTDDTGRGDDTGDREDYGPPWDGASGDSALTPDEIERMTSDQLASAIRKELLKNLDLYKPGTKNANRVIRMLQRDASSEYADTGEVASYEQIRDRYDTEIFKKIKDIFENVTIRENRNMDSKAIAQVVSGYVTFDHGTENSFVVHKESEIAVEFRSPRETAQLMDAGATDSFEKLFAHESAHLFKAAFGIAAGNDIFVNKENFKDAAGDIGRMQAQDIKSIFSSDETWGGSTGEQRAELITYRNWLESQTDEGYTEEIVDVLCFRRKLSDNANNRQVFDKILDDLDRKYNILGPEDPSNIYQRIIRGAKSGLTISNLRVNSSPHMDLHLDIVKYLDCDMDSKKIDIMNRIVKSDVTSDTSVSENRWLQIAGLL
jgi:hypothetical protein